MKKAIAPAVAATHDVMTLAFAARQQAAPMKSAMLLGIARRIATFHVSPACKRELQALCDEIIN